VVLKNTSGGFNPFTYGTLTLYGCPFQGPLVRTKLCNSVADFGSAFSRLTTPVVACDYSGLGSSPFVRHY
jgi:hypothetical protein